MTETVYFELTTFCPANCPHCHIPEELRHRHHQTQRFAHVTFNLELLRDTFQTENVVFSGGEPTFHPEIEEIVKFSSENLSMKTSVISNCINPEKLRKLSEYAQIWVSLDFYGVQQDKYRGVKVWQNYLSIAHLVNVRATLMRINVRHIKKLITETCNCNKQITIVPFKGETLAPTPRQLQQVLLYIFRNNYAEKAVIDSPAVRMFIHQKLKTKPDGLCPAAKTIIKVTPEQTVTPCPFLNQPICKTTDPQIKQKIAQARQQLTATYTGKCRSCPQKTQCGGCKASLNTECFLTP